MLEIAFTWSCILASSMALFLLPLNFQGFAPLAIKNKQTSACPFDAAPCNGDRPSWFDLFGSAPIVIVFFFPITKKKQKEKKQNGKKKKKK